MTRVRRTFRWLLFCGACLALSLAPAYAASPFAPDATPPEAAGSHKAEAELAEQSREAGLLTDWHLMGHYGHTVSDFARAFVPERRAAAQALGLSAAQLPNATAAPAEQLPGQRLPNQRFELLFPEGTFALPRNLAARQGVFYAISSVYLSGDGEWNLYLESPAEAVVFVDGVRVLARDAGQTGAQRETIHADSGYHMVMVKFLARSAPFRVAILPPNSGSRRKNNTPHLSGTENLNAVLRTLPFPG